MEKTFDINVRSFDPLISPKTLAKEIPISESAGNAVISAREQIQNILLKKDHRLLIIVGPCSIHDERAALEYAEGLNSLKEKVASTMFLVMRVYFEKPRTSLGWKGMINDPMLDGSCDIITGLRKARRLLLQITKRDFLPQRRCLIPSHPST
jgi:3-deoxy-7-phosphoheptulonate synthase